MVTNNPKKTIRLKRSNIDLINELQKAVKIEEGKQVSMTEIVNIALSELFNKRNNQNEVDFMKTVEVLRCYNIL